MERTRQTICMSIMGDATKVDAFGGLPHFLAEALERDLACRGHENAINVRRLHLDRTSYLARSARVLWSLSGVLVDVKIRRGWQFSYFASKIAWRRIRLEEQDHLLSLFQLVPDEVSDTVGSVTFYIDATIRQLVDNYDIRISDERKAEVLIREKRGYTRAKHIFVLTEWAGRSLIDDYGIDSSKIEVLTPGTNLDQKYVSVGGKGARDEKLRLVFIGKDWKRKGLDIVLDALAEVNRNSVRILLDVVGLSARDIPSRLRDVSGLTFWGFLDKIDDQEALREILSRADCGIVMSRSEAAGIAVREFYSVELPVIATGADGMAEMLIPDASLVVDLNARSLGLALENLLLDTSTLTKMAQFLRRNPISIGWDSPAHAICSSILEDVPDDDTGLGDESSSTLSRTSMARDIEPNRDVSRIPRFGRGE